MTEYILGGIIIFLLVFIYLKDKQIIEERRSLINGVLSKNSNEFAHAEAIVEEVKEKRESPPPEFIDSSTVSDDDFIEAVTKSNE